MNITDYILQNNKALQRHDEAEWSGASGSNYSAFNDGGIECETGEFLYGLIRMMKPQYVLETGTHHGVGASYMGLALKENGFGELHTFEFIKENYEIAKDNIARLEIQDYITMCLMDVAEYVPEFKYDIVLLDTEPQTRFQEFLQMWQNVNEGGFIFIHDLHQHMHQIPNEEHGFAWPYGRIPEQLINLYKKGKIRPFHFSTPRGLTGFYKVHQDDYKW